MSKTFQRNNKYNCEAFLFKGKMIDIKLENYSGGRKADRCYYIALSKKRNLVKCLGTSKYT